MTVNAPVIEQFRTSGDARPESTSPSEAGSPTEPAPSLVIEPPRGWTSLNLAELWRYRDLLSLLIWRDISSRYRQSVIGYGWAVLKPVLTMVIFTVIFGRVAKIPSDGAPWALFCFVALVPWMYFSSSVSSVTTSVVQSSQFLTKVYFPRLVLPLASAAVGLMEWAVQMLVLAVLMAAYQVVPPWHIVFAPVFAVICVLVTLAFGIWLTALNVKYRDVGQIVPFLLQAWMYLCPIVYPISLIPPRWRLIYALNPMVGVVEGFRWSILGTSTPDWTMMFVSLAMVTGLFVGGLYYFRKTEIAFADVI
jgi:lipopolysaccharide transport system permease protein